MKANPKIVFIGCCFPNEKLDDLIKDKMIDDLPANIFGWKIVESLFINNCVCEIINDHRIPKYRLSKVIVKRKTVEKLNNLNFINIWYLNIPIVRKLTKCISIIYELFKAKPKCILVYSIHTPYMLPMYVYSKLKPSIKVIVITPDLPTYMSSYVGIKKILKKLDIKFLTLLQKRANGFVLLTKYMKYYLEENKKYIIIEGIADSENDGYIDNKTDNHEMYILYTGNVSRKYGLPKFIEIFLKINSNYKLYVCGNGDYVSELKKISFENKCIVYMGVLPRRDVLILQKKARLLINPRSADDEYTKYSFPSKTMEYLLSGTPVMMEKLPGIPDEYYNYIIEVKNHDWEKSLLDFFTTEYELYKYRGVEGKKYVMENKSKRSQGYKIKKFIEDVINEN